MTLLILAAIILLILGFFNPGASLFWYSGQKTRMLSLLIYGGAVVLFIYLKAPAGNASDVSEAVYPEMPDTTVTEVPEPAAADPAALETERVREILKARAARDWPNDYTTQEYWINQELEDYRYMLMVPDGPVKRQAARDWPYDFSTQRYWYNEQVEARARLNGE